jgi:hypothetical protein
MQNIHNKFSSFINSLNFKRFLLLLFCVGAISGAAGSYYFYNKYQALLANPNVEAEKQTEDLIAALGELMELPADETPTLAVISDKEKLENQPFFQSVENGDILFAYTVSMKAILYRPSTNKIIEVAPINLAAEETSPVTVAYYNGTLTTGLALNAEKLVEENFSNFQTAVVSAAAHSDYKTTLVIDLSGQHGEEAAELAAFLNGTVASMPADENVPTADILIIYGQ